MATNLQVCLNPPSLEAPSSFSPPVAVPIHLAVLNHAETPTTFLTWNTPLDPRANILGVFEIRDADADQVLVLDTVKFARNLPPPREDFVTIPPGGKVDADVTLPRVPLVQGRQYTIQAKGWWQAVWEKGVEDIPQDELNSLSGDLNRGLFESEAVPIHGT